MKRDLIALAALLLTTAACQPPPSIWFYDGDSDGFGDPDWEKSIAAEVKPAGYVRNKLDCDDGDANNFPGNTEVEDGSDNNCNGLVDEEVSWFLDADLDGFGDQYNTVSSVLQPQGYTRNYTDCDDSDPNVFPGNSEIFDGLDNDCDGSVDEGIPGSVHTVAAFPRLQHPLRLAVFITNAGDQSNRLFVVRKLGSIEVFKNEPSVTSGTTFLDISAEVVSDNPEEGMLGLAFHPEYADNGYFYVYYAQRSPHSMILARYSVSAIDPNRADPASKQVVLEIPQDSINHKGGTVAFGPDGYLYLGVGDGSTTGDPAGHGQDTTTVRGAMLRIDVNSASPYAIPADNPFANDTGNLIRKEIWAYGLRNPYRFSFDRLTGNLWAGDVGLQTQEEIDVIVKGGNYGWNIWEGTHRRKPGTADGFIFPVHTYNHADVGGAAAIIGGHVYRGSIPSLQGKYLYADYLQPGKISVLDIDHDDNFKVLSESEITLKNNSGITVIGQDEAGELYVSVIVTGVIFKIVPGSDGPAAGTEHCSDNTGSEVNWAASNSDCPNLADYNLYADSDKPLGTTNGSGIPFDLNTPLFSDYAHKYRQIFVPPDQKIQYADGELTFPEGTILAKTFYYVDDERLPEAQQAIDLMETRLLINRGASGWASHAYVWNNDTATLALDGDVKPASWIDASGVTQSLDYDIPSRAQCEVCHTAIVEPLGPKIRHINKEYDYGNNHPIENQIDHWAETGVLANAPDPASQPRDPLWGGDPADSTLEERARAYLDNNCAHCHNSTTGEAYYTNLWLSSDQATGPKTGICTSQYGDLPGYSRIIVPGKPEESALIYRVASVEPGNMMPRLAKNMVHKEGLQLLSDWVASLTGDCLP